MKVLNNPEYTHYIKYERMIDGNIRELKRICLEIVDLNTLQECYKLDKNLNNIPKNPKHIEAFLNREIERIQTRVKTKVEMSKDFSEIEKLMSDASEKVKDIKTNIKHSIGRSYSQFANFDVCFNEVRFIGCYQVASLSDCTCLLKHVMRYHILKLDRPKTFIKK